MQVPWCMVLGAWRQALSTPRVRAAETSTHPLSPPPPRTVEHSQACSISRSFMAASSVAKTTHLQVPWCLDLQRPTGTHVQRDFSDFSDFNDSTDRNGRTSPSRACRSRGGGASHGAYRHLHDGRLRRHIPADHIREMDRGYCRCGDCLALHRIRLDVVLL